MNGANPDLAAELRQVPIFRDLEDAQFAWFFSRCEYREFGAGEYLSRAGDTPRYLIVVLSGGFQAKGDGEGIDGPFFSMEAGRVSGILPFSRMTVFPLSIRAVHDTRVLLFDRAHFSEMYQATPDLVPRLVAILTDRVRDSARQTTQFEKLAALGKLSAGLAHELNNPAAAARQASTTAKRLFSCYQELLDDFALATFSPSDLDIIRSLEKQSSQQLASTAVVDSLLRSDREEELATWLDSQGINEAWQMAPTLADADWTAHSLAIAFQSFTPSLLPLALGRLSASIAMEQVLSQIQTSTSRMGELVSAMKDYSFMDRASLVDFDLNHNIATTLKMFGYRFKKGVALETVFDPSLPKICANGGQLNQVWTNLIDNALDAIESHTARPEKGHLRVETRREVDQAIILFTDNGPGIPPGVGERIFEPFFTTKAQGEGTGLGLDMVYRIVRQHHGDIRFETKTGQTTFILRLPLKQPAQTTA